MILVALLAMAQPAPCTVSDRWTVIELGGHLPWISKLAWNKVSLIRGKPFWNGHAIGDKALRSYGRQASKLIPRPMMVLNGYRAECAVLQRYAALLEAALGCDREHCVVSFDPNTLGEPPPPPKRRRKR